MSRRIVTVTKPSRSQAPAHTTRIFGPGQVCLDAQAGDVVLVRHKGLVAAAIRFFERLRVPGTFAWTNHACVALTGGPNATVIQEDARGSVITPLAELGAVTFTVTHFPTTIPQSEAGADFLRKTLGTGYGFLTIPADAFNALTGFEIGFGWGNRMVCSTQTVRYLERLGFVPDRSPYAMTPAHLAWSLAVPNPQGA